MKYNFSEIKELVKEYIGTHKNAIITVNDANDSTYEDIFSADEYRMFEHDYFGNDVKCYYKKAHEIVVVLA